MIRSLLFLGIFVVVFYNGCDSQKETYVKKFYAEIDSKVPRIIGPGDFGNDVFFYVAFADNMEYSGYCGIFFAKPNNNFREDSIALSQKSKFRSLLQDRCNLFIGDSRPDDSCRNYLPIPGISNDHSPLKRFSIDTASTVLVLDYSTGYFLNKSFDAKHLDLPEKFIHGYSTGAILTKGDSIIMWQILW